MANQCRDLDDTHRPLNHLGNALEVHPADNATQEQYLESSNSSNGPFAPSLEFSSVVYNMITGMVGVGVFGLVGLATRGGLYVSVICLVVSAAVLIEASTLYVECMLVWNAKRGHEYRITSLVTFGHAAFGTTGKSMYALATTVFYLGMCSLFVLQTGTQFKRLIGLSETFSVRWVRFWFAPLYFILAMFRKLTALEKLAIVGAFTSFFSAVTVMLKAMMDTGRWEKWTDLQNERQITHDWPTDYQSIGALIGITFSSYGIVGVIPTQASEMKEPKKIYKAVCIAVSSVAVLYSTITVFGHLAYGEFVCKTDCVTNMEYYPNSFSEAFDPKLQCGPGWTGSSGKIWSRTAASMVVVNLVLSYPVLFMTVMAGLQDLHFVSAICPFGSRGDYLLRTSLVIITLLCGIFVDKLDVMLGFIGALTMPFASMAFPVACSWKLRKILGMKPLGWGRIVFHIILGSFSLFALIFGVYDTGLELFS